VYDPAKTELAFRVGEDFAGWEPEVVGEPEFRNVTPEMLRRGHRRRQVEEIEAEISTRLGLEAGEPLPEGAHAAVFGVSSPARYAAEEGELKQLRDLPFHAQPLTPGGATMSKTLSAIGNAFAALTESAVQGHMANSIRDTEETLGMWGWTDKKGTASDDAVLRGRHGYSPDAYFPADESGLIPPGPMETELPERISPNETYGESLQRWKDHPTFLLNKGLSFDKLYSELVRVHHERPMAAQIALGLSGPEGLFPWVGLIPRGAYAGKALMPLSGAIKFGGREMGQTVAGRAAVDAMRADMVGTKRAVQQGLVDKQALLDMFEAASDRGYVQFKGYGKGVKSKHLDAWLSDAFIFSYDEAFPLLKIAGGLDLGVRIPKTGAFADQRFAKYWESKGLAQASEITAAQADQFLREIYEVHARPVQDRIEKLRDVRQAIDKLQQDASVHGNKRIMILIEQLYTPAYARDEFPMNKAEALLAIDDLKAVEEEILEGFRELGIEVLQQKETAAARALELAKVANSPEAAAGRIGADIAALQDASVANVSLDAQPRQDALRKIRRLIGQIDDSEVDGLSGVRDALEAYKDANKGPIPKGLAWENVVKAINNLGEITAHEANPMETIPPDIVGKVRLTLRSGGVEEFPNINIDEALQPGGMMDNLADDADAPSRYVDAALVGNDGTVHRLTSFTWDARGDLPGGEFAGAVQQQAGTPLKATLKTTINKQIARAENYVHMLFDDEPGVQGRIARAVGLGAPTPPVVTRIPGDLPFSVPRAFGEAITGVNVSAMGFPKGPNVELNIGGIKARVVLNERNNSFWVELLRTEGTPSISSLQELKKFIQELRDVNTDISFQIMAHDAKRARVYERAGFTVEQVMEGGVEAGTGRVLSAEESLVTLSMPPRGVLPPSVTDNQITLARNEITRAAEMSLGRFGRQLPDDMFVWRVELPEGMARRHVPTSVYLTREAAEQAAARSGAFMEAGVGGVPVVHSYRVAKKDVLADMGSLYPRNPARQDELLVRIRNLRSPASDVMAAWEAPGQGYNYYVTEITVRETTPTVMQTGNYIAVNKKPGPGKAQWELSKRSEAWQFEEIASVEGVFTNKAAAKQALEESEQAFRAEAGHRVRSPMPGDVFGSLAELGPSASWEPAPVRTLANYVRKQQGRRREGIYEEQFEEGYREAVGQPYEVPTGGLPREPREPAGVLPPGVTTPSGPSSAWPKADVSDIEKWRGPVADNYRASLFGQSQLSQEPKITFLQKVGKPRDWYWKFRKGFDNLYAHADDIERQAESWWLLNKGEQIPGWARPGMMASLHRGSPVWAHRRYNEFMDALAEALGPGETVMGHFSGTVDRDALSVYLFNRHMREIHDMYPERSLRDVRARNQRDIKAGKEAFLPLWAARRMSGFEAAQKPGERGVAFKIGDNERVSQGYVRTLYDKVIENLHIEHGDLAFTRLIEAGELVRDEYRRLLDERVAEGIVRPEVAVTLQRNYPFYHPLKYIETQGFSGLWQPKVGNRILGHTAGLPTNDLHFLANIGSEATPVDPLSMFDRTFMHHELAITINRTTRAYIHAMRALEVRDGQFVKRGGELLVVAGTRAAESPLRAAEELWMPQYMSGTYVEPAGDRALGIAGTAKVKFMKGTGWEPGSLGEKVFQRQTMPEMQYPANITPETDATILSPGVYSFMTDPQALRRQRQGQLIAPVDYVTNTPEEYVTRQQVRVDEKGAVSVLHGKEPAPGKEYVQYWENGMPQMYEVPAWLAEDLNNLSRFDQHIITRIMHTIQNPYRSIITSHNPVFMAGNFLYETLQLAIVHGIMPWTSANNLRIAMMDIFRSDDKIREMTRNRGLVLGLTGRPVERMFQQAVTGRIMMETPADRNRLMGSISKLMDSELAQQLGVPEVAGAGRAVGKSAAATLRGLARSAEAFETGPRRAIYVTYKDRYTKEAYDQAYKKYFEQERQMLDVRQGMPEGRPTPEREYITLEGERITLKEVPSRAAAKAQKEVDGMAPAIQARAAYEARTGMVDYQRWGSVIHFADAFFLYLNAGVQGALAPLRYAVRPSTGGESRPLGAIPTPAFMRQHASQTRLAVGIAGLQGLTASLFYMNMANSHERNSYWNIPLKDRVGRLAILLPGDGIYENGVWKSRYINLVPLREFAFFSGTVTYFLEALFEKGRGVDLMALGGALSGEMNPVQAVAPIESSAETPKLGVRMPTQIGAAVVEGIQNWDDYRNQAIVPPNLQDAPRSEQWNASTTDVARKVGGVIRMSPMMVDHYAKVGVIGEAMSGADIFIRKFDPNEDHPLLEQMASDLVENMEMLQAMSGQDVWDEEDWQALQYAPLRLGEAAKGAGRRARERIMMDGSERTHKEFWREYLKSLPPISKDEFVNRDKAMSAGEVEAKVEAIALKIVRGPRLPGVSRFYRVTGSGRRAHAARQAQRELGVSPDEQRKAASEFAEFVHGQHSDQWSIDKQLMNYDEAGKLSMGDGRPWEELDKREQSELLAELGPIMTGKEWKHNRSIQNQLLQIKILEIAEKYPASSFALPNGERKEYANIMSTLAGLWPDNASKGELLLTMWRSLANPIDPDDPEKESLYGERDGDDALFISADHRRPHYLAQDAFLDGLTDSDREALQKARESYMTPMERRWERGKEIMKPYWEVDTEMLDTLTGKDHTFWNEWLRANNDQRVVLRRLNPSKLSKIQGRIRLLRKNKLNRSKALQEELTFWGYITERRYLNEEAIRRQSAVMPQSFAPTGPGTTATPVSGLVPPAAEQYAPEETEPPGTVRQQQQPVLAP